MGENDQEKPVRMDGVNIGSGCACICPKKLLSDETTMKW